MLNLLSYVFFKDADGPHDVSAAGLLLVALAAVPLLVRRRHPVPALAAVLALDVTASVVVPLPSHFGAVLVVALYAVVRACTGRVSAVAAGGTASLMLLSQHYGRIPPWQQAVSPFLTALIVAGAALVVNRWQREAAANRRLLAERAVSDERRRIARELHDIVAHHITTMQLMAGGARANLARPEVAREALVTLESSGRLALSDMRQLLDVLRADDEPETLPALPQPGADDLDRLVAESCRAGLPTGFTVRGQRRPLPPTVGLTVFRIAQEALTNTRKHAGAARATVHLTYGQEMVTVEVRDDGRMVPPQEWSSSAPRAGHGLLGMRERVALHGGTLTTGPQADGGFAVVAALPLGGPDPAGPGPVPSTGSDTGTGPVAGRRTDPTPRTATAATTATAVPHEGAHP
ncbi:sensor histidine kinase [Streptomyces candidus]|uniref:histidine kinase n=1 Tax=Streptomyces candidus TaxID=67283 RepID=A0A7X0LRU4_9ACTN|nr:sensor histidine kinase [Streptomyces candidus]MBB6439003.1 signal transduction histidine kinase [Streptomyces candidus]